jgi:glycine/D-amino acid oxidase-like deaminating enzyme
VPDLDVDVAIVGGAAVGSAVASFLALLDPKLSIALIEQDPTFRYASSSLSAAAIRQQFSTPENIRLSRFGLEYLRAMPEAQGEDPSLVTGGYLILAPDGTEEIARDLNRIQLAEGAPVILLDRNALAARFSWLSLAGIALGSLGTADEGWFDANALLRALRKDARDRGVRLVTGKVAMIELAAGRVASVGLEDGSTIRCGTLVNAAGPGAGRLAAMAGRALPVEPRKRSVFVVDCPGGPAPMPLVADPSGFWLRPEGARYLTGLSPAAGHDGPCDPADFEPDHAIFEDALWPALAARVPAFETLRVVSAWAGHYDYNVLDQNAVIGRDPQIDNFIYANGFSGHGLQQAPGVGRAVAELIVHVEYRAIDLTRFGYGRVARSEPMPERNVI